MMNKKTTNKENGAEIFIEKMKSVQSKLLDYIDNEQNVEENYEIFISQIKDHKILQNQSDVKALLRLIIKIANHHHRPPSFFSKIEKILLFLKDAIKQTYSNMELFQLFKKHKRILLFFFEENIIKIDEELSDKLMFSADNSRYGYTKFFFNELKPFFSKNKIKNIKEKIPVNSDELRKLGVNESDICEIIRKDSLVDFISHVSNTNLPLSSKVKVSIYETNLFLVKNQASLIEYAAFYGSIEIFGYLLSQKVEIKQSIYLFAIHGRNLELIHLLEENKIQSPDKSFTDCIKESIKCHHIEIANYFIGHLQTENEQLSKNIIGYCLHYYNYLFLPDDVLNKSTDVFNFACRYNHLELVSFLLKTKSVNILQPIILEIFCFMVKFYC